MSKVWWDWQNYDVQSNFWNFDTNTTWFDDDPVDSNLDYVMPLDGFFQEMRVRDVVNITGGFLCYVYE